MLLDVNAAICFKFRLQLKFRSNKKYSSIIVNFYTCLRQKKKTHEIKIEIQNNKS